MYDEYDEVDDLPQFPGGASALFNYLSVVMQYPEEDEANGIQGRVVVSFIVEKDGSISDIKLVNSVSPGLDAEALRVVRTLPHFIPGKKNGVPVRVRYSVPVTFRLQ